MSQLVSDMNVRGVLVPLLAALAWVVTVVAALVLGLAITHNLNAESTPLLVMIIGFAGSLVTVVLLVVQVTLNAAKLNNVQEAVNGHMKAHEQLTQKLVQDMPGSPNPPTTGGATP